MNSVAQQTWTRAPARTAPGEWGMRAMLTALIMLLAAGDIFDLQVSLGPGLSSKNFFLYLLAVALLFKYAVRGGFVLELRAVLACFAILIGYATLTTFAAALVIDYPRYSLIKSGMTLKSRLVDQAVFFVVFFYALHESRNALSMLRVVVLAAALANVVGVLNAFGVVQIGELDERMGGRMHGAIGEPNQYGAFIILFLPILIVAALTWRGKLRPLWIVGLLISAAALLMTASRGAFLALALAGLCSAFMYRRLVSWGAIVRMGALACVLIGAALIALSARYGELLYRRVIRDSVSGDLVSASSGRTEVWMTAIERMMQAPVTLLSGFGWDVYWIMPFRFAPHNHYLGLWFNLGMIGLICGVALLALAIVTAHRAAAQAEPTERRVLISFAIGALALAIAAFFVDLYTPWIWFWAYAGLVLRIAVNNAKQVKWVDAAADARAARGAANESRRDPFGWRGSVQRGPRRARPRRGGAAHGRPA